MIHLPTSFIDSLRSALPNHNQVTSWRLNRLFCITVYLYVHNFNTQKTCVLSE